MARSVVTVLFGDNQSVLLNSNCSSINLLDAIKRKMGLFHEADLVIDLVDVQGNVLQLHRNLKAPASNFLKDQPYYFVVRKQMIEPDDTSTCSDPNAYGDARLADSTTTFITLLQDCSKIAPGFQVPTIIAGSTVATNATRKLVRGNNNVQMSDFKKMDGRKAAIK